MFARLDRVDGLARNPDLLGKGRLRQTRCLPPCFDIVEKVAQR